MATHSNTELVNFAQSANAKAFTSILKQFVSICVALKLIL
jgi:hypothetical protein